MTTIRMVVRLLIVAGGGILAGMSFQEPNALQIRVALAEIEPAIWRRLIVPRSFRLGQLHRVIQAAFGWWDCHLHEFRIGSLSYRDAEFCEPEFEDDARSFDESEVRLRDFDRSEGLSFLYVYDFGDNWKHVSQSRSRYPLRWVIRSAVRSPCAAPVRLSTSSSIRRCAAKPIISRSRSVSELFSKSA